MAGERVQCVQNTDLGKAKQRKQQKVEISASLCRSKYTNVYQIRSQRPKAKNKLRNLKTARKVGH